MTKTPPTTQAATETSPLSLASAINALTRKQQYPLRILTRSDIKTLLPGLEKMAKDADPYISELARRIIDKRTTTAPGAQGVSYRALSEVRLTPQVVAHLGPYLTKLDQAHSAPDPTPNNATPDGNAQRPTLQTGHSAKPHVKKAVNG